MSAKRRRTSPPAAPGLSYADRNLLIRLIGVSSVLLAIALVLMHVLLAGLVAASPGWLSGLRTALGLLIFWLFVTAAVRALHQFLPRIPLFWAMVAGVGTAAGGMLLFLLGLRLVALIWESEVGLPRYNIIWFYVLGGLFASLISLIHLRVRNRRLGYVLEALLIVAGMVLFFWLA